MNSKQEDNQGDDANNEDQLVNVPSQHVEVQYQEQEEWAPIEVEESVPERGHKGETIPLTEKEVQIIPPPVPVQHLPPTFVKTLQDRSPHYNKLSTKRPRVSLMSPLKGHI